MIIYILIFCFLVVWIIGAIFRVLNRGKKEDEREQWRKEMREKREKAFEEKKQIYELKKGEQTIRLGEADKVIPIEEYDIDKEIAIFEQAEKIVLLGNELSFSDILSCTAEDDYKVIRGKTEYTSQTKASNGSTVGRAIVGGVLAGGAGAIIGGSTAKKETTTLVHQKDDIIIHRYSVIVNVNSLTNPIITIPLWDDKAKLNEIVGLLNVIIKKGEK